MASETVEWDTFPLDDLTEDEAPITYGVVKPGEEGDVLFVRGGDIAGGRVLIDQLRTIGRDVSQQYRRTLLRGGEILVSLVGNPGQVAIAPPSLAGANIARQVGLVRLKPGIDPRFISYFLQSRDGQASLGAQSLGSVQQVINLRDLRTVKVPLPPLPEQKAIAAVLGALDDKIELNRRMNATLEAMARALFQSWFVDFDPVRAKAEGCPPAGLDEPTAALFPAQFQGSELGEIPQGWAVLPFAQAFQVKDGATFKKEDRLESGEIIAFGANGPVGFCKRANETEPCIVLGKIGSCGSLHRAWEPCWITNNAFRVKPAGSGSLEFVWQTLRRTDFKQFVGGSANPYMPLKNFGESPILMPPIKILAAYQARVEVLAAKAVSNDRQSRTLATLRDTLLPKLLSGELRVSDATALAEQAG